jgi:hypothetical protein
VREQILLEARGTSDAMANENAAARNAPLFMHLAALLWLRKPQRIDEDRQIARLLILRRLSTVHI